MRTLLIEEEHSTLLINLEDVMTVQCVRTKKDIRSPFTYEIILIMRNNTKYQVPLFNEEEFKALKAKLKEIHRETV